MNNLNGFSVIIPTYNRLDHLKACLKSVKSLNSSNFEIIIVDDASTDGTKEYLDNLRDPLIKVIHNAVNSGQAVSRNEGVKMAKHDLLAFTDDDCLVDSQWLNELGKGFDNPAVGFVFGATFYISQNYRGYFPERIVTNQNGRWPGSGNLAYRNEVFQKIGGFNPYFLKYNNEDSELAIRAVSRGIKYYRAPNAFVCHQKQFWRVKTLLNSARNNSLWPMMKKMYPRHYRTFKSPAIGGFIVNPQEYLYIIFFPVFVCLLLIRYLLHGQRNLGIFFAKWPVWLILKRFYIYYEAVKNRVFMI